MSTALSYDDHDAFRASLAMYPCRYCTGSGVEFHGPGASDHYAAFICTWCGKSVGWMPWPPTLQKRDTSRRRSRTPIKLDENRCHVCGRNHAQVSAAGTSLQAHHLIDRAALVDAGVDPDDLKYLAWICANPCHTIVTALRKSFGTYASLIYAFGAVEGAADGIEPEL